MEEEQIQVKVEGKEKKWMICKQVCAFLFALGILVFTIYENMYCTRCIHRRVIIASAIPLMHMLIRIVRQNRNKRVIGSHLIWLAVYVIGYYICWWMVIPFAETARIQGIDYYERCMNYYGEDDHRMFYFPTQIPEGIKNPHFTDFPKFLQGAQQTALSYDTTQDEIDYYLNTYKEDAVYFGSYIETEKNNSYSPYSKDNDIWDEGLDLEIGKYCPPKFATKYIGGM